MNRSVDYFINNNRETVYFNLLHTFRISLVIWCWLALLCSRIIRFNSDSWSSAGFLEEHWSTISGTYEERKLQNLVFHQKNCFSQCDFSSVFIHWEVAVIVSKVNGVFDPPVAASIWIFCRSLWVELHKSSLILSLTIIDQCHKDYYAIATMTWNSLTSDKVSHQHRSAQQLYLHFILQMEQMKGPKTDPWGTSSSISAVNNIVQILRK